MKLMVIFAFAVLLVIAALAGVILEKAYFYLPIKELERRSARGDSLSAKLAQVAVLGGEARLALLAVGLLAISGAAVLFAQALPRWAAFAVITLTLGLMFIWLPRTKLTALEARLAGTCAPALTWLMRKLWPVISPIAREVRRFYRPRTHTGLFEQSDVTELLVRQSRQRDNRIPRADLERLRGVLQAGSRRVEKVLVPRKSVVAINADDPISPVLVDELHRSGHSQFPVYEGNAKRVVGVLTLEQISNIKQQGKVRNYTDTHLVYLHERDTVEQALRAYFETHQTLFIVLNRHGDYAGIITLGGVLHELFGDLELTAFGKHDDPLAVMQRHEQTKSNIQTTPEVIE